MNVLLYVPWEVDIEDVGDVMDVQPPGRQVGGDQDANATC